MKRFLALAMVGCMLLSGCSSSNSEEDSLPRIATTNYITYTITKTIAGNTANVILLDIEDKNAEADAKTLSTLREADILIYTSDEEEPWVKVAKEDELSDVGLKFISASKGINEYPIQYEDNMFTSADEEVVVEDPEETPTPTPQATPESTSEPEETTENSETTEEQVTSSETSQEETSQEETTSQENEETAKIREEIANLKQYDTVSQNSTLYKKLSETQSKNNSSTVKYALDGKLYVFAYSSNNRSFFFLEIQQLNAITEQDVDPYYWLSFDNMRIMADNITEGINLAIDTETSTRSQNNAWYQNQIDKLEDDYNSAIDKNSSINIISDYIPQILIDDFNLKFSAVYNGEKPTLKDKSAYCDYLERNEISTALFGLTDNYEKEILTETGLEVAEFNPLETVSDNEKSYFDYMRENLESLKACLG